MENPIKTKIKKILIFSHEFPPFGGGAGVVAWQFASELKNNGYDITILTSYKRHKTNDTLFNMIHNKNNSKFWFFGYRNIDFNQFDFILLNDPSAIYCGGLFFNKELLKKSICFLHGSEPERVYEKTTLLRKVSFFKFYFTRALQNCKTIISPSVFMKNKFLNKTKLYNLDNQINVLYAGVDKNIFYKKQEQKQDSESLTFISVSRIEKKKGYKRKYHIFKNLIMENIIQNIKWVIVGDGTYLEVLKKMVHHDGLESYIQFTGQVNRNHLVDYYNNADIFWLLSEYEESFGLVYIEAQMSGLIAIGNNNAGVKEAIDNNKSGFLVNSDEDIYNIIQDKLYLNIKSKDIKKFINEFDLEQQTRKLVEIMENKL